MVVGVYVKEGYVVVVIVLLYLFEVWCFDNVGVVCGVLEVYDEDVVVVVVICDFFFGFCDFFECYWFFVFVLWDFDDLEVFCDEVFFVVIFILLGKGVVGCVFCE